MTEMTSYNRTKWPTRHTLFITWPFAEIMEGGKKNKALKETKKNLKEIKMQIKEPTEKAHRSTCHSSLRCSRREGGLLDWSKTGCCSRAADSRDITGGLVPHLESPAVTRYPTLVAVTDLKSLQKVEGTG